jgi:hypothetical protein
MEIQVWLTRQKVMHEVLTAPAVPLPG